MSSSAVLKQFYSKLVETLPMNDAIFIAKLYSCDLLPHDLKERVESLRTEAEKTMYFIDHMIKPSVTSDDGSSFDKLLNVMESCNGYPCVKELANQIRASIRKRSNSDNG